MQDDDDTPPLTEAERISQTRFGARPIPKGHRRPKIDRSDDYRRIPPHGDVSPDGQRIWPHPSTAAKLLVWGGTAAAAVAVTAGTALALRRIGDALSGDKPHRTARPVRPARYGADDFGAQDPGLRRAERRQPKAQADPDHPVRERSQAFAARPQPRRAQDDRFADQPLKGQRLGQRQGAPLRDRHDVEPADRYRDQPRHDDDEFRPRRRKPRNLIAEFEDNSRRVTHSVDGLFGSLGTAMAGFLSVARQAGTIMREFGDAADLVRAVMDSTRKPGDEEPRPRADADKDRRTHNL